MRTLAALSGMAALAIAVPAAAQCGPGAGGCFEPHTSPGCMQPECCGLVCGSDPVCCSFEWDQFCVQAAVSLCVGLVCPNTGPCFEPHASVGCLDAACCSLITSVDPFCRSVAWDRFCASRAVELCGVAACSLEIPAAARSEGEACYERLNDGCPPTGPAFGSIACGEIVRGKWTSGPIRDLDWLRIAPGVASVKVRAEFPAVLQLVEGECEDRIEVLEEAAIAACGEIEFEVPPGVAELFVVISGGTVQSAFRSAFACDEVDPDNPPDPNAPPPPPAPFGRLYLLEALCGCALVGDLDGDCRVGGSDLAILLTNWGLPGPSDLDGNGTTDGADLAMLLSAWTPPGR
jgi:hypothetical protein